MRLGSLFSGYGGLDMAVENVLGTTTAWVSDIDKGANKILAHHYPDVPNLGDISTVDWADVEPIDVLTGGFPCQDLSHAGKRAGLRPDTRSGLWTQMAYAIDQLRPRLVVAENVRGLLSAEAHSDVEPCPWCLGDQPRAHLRALGAVLGDLADLGYDASWHSLRASDVGACHGRFRVFVVAYPSTPTQDAHGTTGGERGKPTPRQAASRRPRADPRGRDRAPGPLLPTPAVNDMGAGKTVEDWDAWTDRMKAEHGNGNGHGASLAIEAQRLLPTPTDVTKGGGRARSGDRAGEALLNGIDRLLPTPVGADARGSRQSTAPNPRATNDTLSDVSYKAEFGQYAAVVGRWATVLARPAPAPTEPTGRNQAHRLSPAFVEWMMGLPAGHVTDVPNLTRNEQLKALGNGVVPQQAEAALRLLLPTAVAA